LGILIPPSVVTIVYAVTAQVSIGQMFIGGIIPGLLLAGLYVAYIVIRSLIDPSIAPRDPSPVAWGARIRSLRALILPFLIIIGVLGSIYAGIATPTEAAAVGVAGAIVSAAVERRLSLSMLSGAGIDTIKVTAMILWITMGAKAFVAIFTGTGGADFLLEFIRDLDANRWLVLAAMMGVLVFLGLFLDEIGI
ncbi:MAG TPA: TRAP transporter permease DctM/Q, partial [Tistrella mobilis]|nr:TRAP transporter permease DctM/Q [Tistrella mobilis]